MAPERQNLHAWQPAAQQQTLTQILQQLQQLQQVPAQLQQLQQQQTQMQQQQTHMQTQLQQVEGALMQRIADVDHNAHTRVINSQLNGPQQVGWVRNDAGQEPQQPPMTREALRTNMSGAAVNAVLGHYGLPVQGTVQQRRNRLLHHLGITV
ncbi:hypothetical protein MNEG_2038 [Monoraphidium neglectum]|uniref:Uncharacterized protein n=1 Tax=Monoraphidium neglectum TaxID=145388 RepID=A0A0D2K6F1_9CHLO|nr:hypothetical protein MNEG_2038 [Monoraphidium neglectum]KIZ05923.1 hypothetical protein MNEG_2038 [Monoraphidium neglectum]|eukprot:XP_013904942.1 hypothetical protein MNEG_2038 [Monoraphidium neglectum]